MARKHTMLQSTRFRYFHKLQKLTKLLTKRTTYTTLLNKGYRPSSVNSERHSIVQLESQFKSQFTTQSTSNYHSFPILHEPTNHSQNISLSGERH